MNIEVAQKAGACYGVQRALELAREAARADAPAHTLGPLIHNPTVVAELAAMGVGVAETLDDAKDGTLVLRSHGTAPDVVAAALARGFDVVDATCPYVSKVQRQAKMLGEQGRGVVIIGEPGHAEVEGIRAWGGDAVVAVAASPEMLPDALPARVGVVIQTTQSAERVDSVLFAIRERCDDVEVKDTVCLATQERQKAAAELAERSDAMIVIGGRNSGNTRRLFEICSARCERTHHIELAAELEAAWFAGVRNVGVTAGASTPQEQIDEVCARLAEFGKGA